MTKIKKQSKIAIGLVIKIIYIDPKIF